MIIYCKRCGYSEFISGKEEEKYNAWSQNKRLKNPFNCVKCNEVLMNELDWEVY